MKLYVYIGTVNYREKSTEEHAFNYIRKYKGHII